MCWQNIGLWHDVQQHLQRNEIIADIIFSILHELSWDQAAKFSVVLWSIWKQRNNMIWGNEYETRYAVCTRAITLLEDWKTAQNMHSMNSGQQLVQIVASWKKPQVGRYKCNVDASFSRAHNKVGIGACIRDDQGQFVLAKTEWFEPILDVDTGEALGLLLAMKWVHELKLENVDFELDSKRVVDNFHSKKLDFSAIIVDCRRVHSKFLKNSHVEFTRRQANAAAHILASVATSLASFHIYIDIPTFIQDIVINKML